MTTPQVVAVGLRRGRVDVAGNRSVAFALLRRYAISLAQGVLAVAIVIALWYGFLKAFHVDHFVSRNPSDVWHYFRTGGPSDEPASQVWHNLGRTLGDAGIGFAAGLAAAVGVAMVFVLSRPVEQSLMPVAMVVRSVPIVGMTPLLTLVFGRGLFGVTVITGIVVFFPALVTVGFGLRSTSRQAADLVRAYGGTGLMVTRKVMVPSALPAIFASARVAVPGAFVGGLLAEYLATGKGLGYLMLYDVQRSNYDQLWAAVALLTATSVVIYYAVGALESAVLARFGPAPGR